MTNFVQAETILPSERNARPLEHFKFPVWSKWWRPEGRDSGLHPPPPRGQRGAQCKLTKRGRINQDECGNNKRWCVLRTWGGAKCLQIWSSMQKIFSCPLWRSTCFFAISSISALRSPWRHHHTMTQSVNLKLEVETAGSAGFYK